MRCSAVFLALAIFGAVRCQNSDDLEAVTDDNVRDMRELDSKGWRAVETIYEGTAEWIPRSDHRDAHSEVIPKRRRIRKRKRRPPVISLTDDEDDITTEKPRLFRRRNRPVRPEIWEEMSEEPSRPYIRRRITPAYDDTHEEMISPSEHSNIPKENLNIEEESSSQSPVEQSTRRENNSNSSNLRALLKQSDGLSLSEILQKKNLSLSELLTGNQKAISALTELPLPTTQAYVDMSTENSRYQRPPQQAELKKTLDRNYEQEGQSFENLSTKQAVELKRKRVPFLKTPKPNRIYQEITNYEVVTEPTTEKRIFVPAHPKYYTSLDYIPNIDLFNEQTTYSIKEETTTPIPTTKPKNYKTPFESRVIKSKLPMTSSKLNKLLTTTTNKKQNNPTTTLPPKAIKISIQEIFGLLPMDNRTEPKDEPLRMKIDLEKLTERPTIMSTIAASSKFYKKIIKTRPTTVTTTTTTSRTTTNTKKEYQDYFNESQEEEKDSRLSAKEEIGEILKDPIGRENLSRILRDRNMTIEELIDQRERGSSQVHLADLFHNKNREPEPNDEPLIGQIIPKFIPKYPQDNVRQQKSLFNSTEAPVTNDPKEIVVTSFPTFKIELHKDANKTQSFLWKELYPDLFKEVPESDNKEQGNAVTDNYLEDIKRLDDIDNAILAASKENLNVDEDAFEEEGVFINIPSGMKSAVLASFAIVGLSLVVFLTILIIFRWTQKQRRKLNYCGPSLSARINPILENGPRNLKSFVTETLGRKKNYYKNHLQSMSDSIWENARKPSF